MTFYYSRGVSRRTVTAALIDAPHIVAEYFAAMLRRFIAEYASCEADLQEGFTRTFDLKHEHEIKWRDDAELAIRKELTKLAVPIIEEMRRAAGRRIRPFRLSGRRVAIASGVLHSKQRYRIDVAIAPKLPPLTDRFHLSERFLAPFVSIQYVSWDKYIAGVTLVDYSRYDRQYPIAVDEKPKGWRDMLDWQYIEQLGLPTSYHALQLGLAERLGADMEALYQGIEKAIAFIAERYKTYTYYHLPGPGGDEPEEEVYAPLGGEFEHMCQALELASLCNRGRPTLQKCE